MLATFLKIVSMLGCTVGRYFPA